MCYRLGFILSILVISIFFSGCPPAQEDPATGSTPTPTSTPEPEIVENLITNGDFSDDISGWTFYKENGESAEYSQINASDEKARITVAADDNSEVWHIILYQKVNIKNNKKYIMGFDYSATIDTSFSLQIQHDGSIDNDWTRTHFYSLIADSPYNILWSYIDNFTMAEDDDFTDFKFNFGTSTNTAEITIDNVFLAEMDNEGDFLETGYWEILKEDDGESVRMAPYDYLHDDNDIDIDGEHEAYMVNAFSSIIDNTMRLYYKFEFIDPGEPAGSAITENYPAMFVYNSDEDITYNRSGNSFTVDSQYFEGGDMFWSCYGNYMLTVSANTTYIYARTTEAAVTNALDDNDFIPPYKY